MAGVVFARKCILWAAWACCRDQVGSPFWGFTDTATWYDFPEIIEQQPLQFWQVIGHGGGPSVSYGRISFEVLTDGPVLMAPTNRWGGGGNPSGDWIPELTTRAELIQQGCTEYAEPMLVYDHKIDMVSGTEHIVFKRDCFAGESFTYRTEKYIPPLIIRSNIPGDCDRDGKVNDMDAAILATYWQYEGPMELGREHGDFNDDGCVTDADAALLATHWQEGVGEGAATVPEPTIPTALLSMVVVGLLAYVWRGRRGRRPQGPRVVGQVPPPAGRANRAPSDAQGPGA